jgi:hypothetical protein
LNEPPEFFEFRFDPGVLEPHTAKNRHSKDGFDVGGAATRSETIPHGLLSGHRALLCFSH